MGGVFSFSAVSTLLISSDTFAISASVCLSRKKRREGRREKERVEGIARVEVANLDVTTSQGS